MRGLVGSFTSSSSSSSSSPNLPAGLGFVSSASGAATVTMEQIVSDTKATVKGWGHNIQEHFANAYGTEPVVVRDPDHRAWLLGRQSRSTADFYSVWRGIRRMTYRKNFETPLYNQQKRLEFHCDTGWGCTIRSAQMLLLAALKRHHGLDPSGAATRQHSEVMPYTEFFDHHPPPSQHSTTVPPERELFEDRLDRPCSIHAFMSCSQPGQWFGPARVCDALQQLTSAPAMQHLGLAVYVDHDGLLRPEDVRATSAGQPPSSRGFGQVTMELVAVEGSPRAGGTSPASSSSGSSIDHRKRSWSLGSRGHEWAVLSPSETAKAMKSMTDSEDITSPSHFVMVGFSGDAAMDSEAVADSSSGDDDEAAWHDCPSASMTPPCPSGDIGATAAGEEWSRGVLLLFPVRLTDGDQIDGGSARVVSEYLKLRWCVGVVGGQSTRAHYIVGVAEKDTYVHPSAWGQPPTTTAGRMVHVDLLSIDPHFVQSAVVEAQSTNFKNSVDPSRLRPSRLNPSLAVGFYVKDETDLEELTAELSCIKDGFIQVSRTACFTPYSMESVSRLPTSAEGLLPRDRVIVL
ncbi:Cysteine protease atg4c [Perkinsus chesapeaki]|uniref:Cysteine protease n=1 Tax=Perkinsus chesapeaki TaxID=330153 RepID=A0A7J6MZM0_PERCH|nr:Cysteine protease atg4c [Perkinsus chesapeaki]